LGLVPAGEQAVLGPQAALGRDDEARAALAGRDGPVGRGDGLQRAHGRRPDGDHAAAPGADGIDEAGGRLRDAVALGVWALAELEARDREALAAGVAREELRPRAAG